MKKILLIIVVGMMLVSACKSSKGTSGGSSKKSSAGPNGEESSYVRVGSCCPFNTPNGLMGGGLLDRYEIKWSGQTAPVYLYLNMYDKDELKAPVGFTIKK